DENFSDPEPDNPYDFRRFVIKTPKKPKEERKKEEEERGPSLDSKLGKSTPKQSPMKKTIETKEPAKKATKPRKTPVKKATGPKKSGITMPSQVQARDSPGPLLANDSSKPLTPKPAGTKGANDGPRSLKASSNQIAGESSESDADNESSEDEDGFADALIVEDIDGGS